MDLSTSMLCEDIKPNRLEIAKASVSQLIGQLDGDKIGLVAFAGDAFIQLPITSDYAAAQMFLNNMNTRTIKVQGTDYTAAIKESLKCFDFENKFFETHNLKSITIGHSIYYIENINTHIHKKKINSIYAWK